MSRNYSTVALPWDGTLRGFLTPKEDADVIRSAVIWIVLTALGERVMLPEFGTIVPTSVMEPNDLELELDVRASIADALATFEDRINVVDIDVLRDTENNRMVIVIKFQNKLDPLRQEVQELRVTPTLVAAR